MSFTDDQVDVSIEFLVRFAEDRGQTTNYSRVFESAGLSPPQDLHLAGEHDLVTAFMKAIHDRCSERGLPPLDALVVHVDGDRKDVPGVGYFRVNRYPDPRDEAVSADDQLRGHNAWQAQVEQCAAWGRDHRRRSRRTAAALGDGDASEAGERGDQVAE